MKLDNIISMDEGTLGGQVVFKGTRVPVETLFDNLETGLSLDVFLEDFPLAQSRILLGKCLPTLSLW